MKQGYTGPQVCKIVGISYRQLDHWTTTKLVKASLRNLKGSGHHREYSFEDLLRVKIIKNLRNGGMSLQKIRIALKALKKILDTGVSFSDVTVVSDGQSIYASKNENDFIDTTSIRTLLEDIINIREKELVSTLKKIEKPIPGIKFNYVRFFFKV